MFPRLTLQIYDVGLAGDEAIGELTLDLRASINLLNKVGVLDNKKILGLILGFGTPFLC